MKREEFYRKAADAYMEQYGADLREEMESLTDESPQTFWQSERLDRKVRRGVSSGERQPMIRGLAMAAACIALILILPRMLETGKDDLAEAYPNSAEAVEEACDEDAGWEAAIGESREIDEMGDGIWEDAADVADAEPEIQAESGMPGLLPLSFALPPGYAVEGETLDQGQSIYYIVHTELDDVVLTMEYADGGDGSPEYAETMTEVDINGQAAYGLSEADYQYLTFQKENIRYTLTCRYDINTLVTLSGAIL